MLDYIIHNFFTINQIIFTLTFMHLNQPVSHSCEVQYFSQQELHQTLLAICHTPSTSTIHASPQAFKDFLPRSISIFHSLNFNIHDLTTTCEKSPIHQLGSAPEWGTELLEGLHFENFRFEKCNFNWLNFCHTVFKNSHFTHCTFEGTVWDEATFDQVTFEECDFKDASFCKSHFTNTSFQASQLCYVNFMEANFHSVSFLANHLQGSNFFGAHAHSFNFQGKTEQVLFYSILPDSPSPSKPIVLISWDNKNPGLSTTKIIKRIQDLGAIPFKVNYKDSAIDPFILKKEVDAILIDSSFIHANAQLSLPKQLLDFAEGKDFPEIAKIKSKARAWVGAVSGLLLPGGQDIQPFFYRETPQAETTVTQDLRRDLIEFALLDELECHPRPLLGICRGMQLVNVWYGGSLLQHVPGHLYCIQEYQLASFTDESFNNSKLAPIFQKNQVPFTGYSFHHQAVKKLGNNLTAMAYAADKTIKSLERLGEQFLLLIQWHPEIKGDYSTPEAAHLDAQLSPGNQEIYQIFVDSLNGSKNH